MKKKKLFSLIFRKQPSKHLRKQLFFFSILKILLIKGKFFPKRLVSINVQDCLIKICIFFLLNLYSFLLIEINIIGTYIYLLFIYKLLKLNFFILFDNVYGLYSVLTDCFIVITCSNLVH